MKITENEGRLVIEPDGNDSPIWNGIPEGAILILRDATVFEVWEQHGKIHSRKITASWSVTYEDFLR